MKNFAMLFVASLLLFSCANNQTASETEQPEELTEATAPIMITDQISNEGVVTMAAEDLWTEVAAFSGTEVLFPDVFASSSLEGNGLGALRTSVLADGSGEVVEEITNIDEETMTLEYKVLSAPYETSDFLVTMQVIPSEVDENNCTLKWSSTYQVDENAATATKAYWQSFQQTGIANWNKLALASAN